MCGIVGLVNADFPPSELPQIISRALSAIGHRGPDGSGYVVADDFVMGTVRLAILDPKAGIQPISDAEGRYWLSYNGEIYNYRELRDELVEKGHTFITQCDTEIVLRSWIEWGENCLARFNGGFAFALYDRKTKRMVLARDKFGKRPLFYFQKGKTLFFASEIKAFLAIPDFSLEQDPEQLCSIVAQWTPLPHQTGFKNITSLPMGQFLLFQKGKISHHTYSDLSFGSSRKFTNEEEAIEQIRVELDKSVSLRLRSDVEVGAYLSGGIDSAIVALLANEHSKHDLFTFSVTFEDKQFDESPEQNLVSRHIGSKHLARHITYKDIVDACPNAVYHAEIPAFRSAFIPMYLLSQLTAENNIKVILSGEGADEAFMGYDLFKETILRSEWNELSEELRSKRLSSLYPHLSHYAEASNSAVAGIYQQFSNEHMPGLFSHEIRFQNGRFSARLIDPKFAVDPFADITDLIQSSNDYASMSAVHKAQWLEYKTLLSGYLLSTQGERMSLSHGVENRCPFLDPSVIDLASATNLKFDNGFIEKRLLREAFRSELPAEVVDKRKFPYRAPDTEAFIAEKPDYLDLILSDTELSKLPFINKKFSGLLMKKLMNTESKNISTKEHQTFMFLLTIALINYFFVARNGKSNTSELGNLPPLEKVVDLRTQVSHGNLSSST